MNLSDAPMTMTNAPWPIKALLSLFLLAWLAGFASAGLGILVILVRTRLFFGASEDGNLPFFERWYRRNVRMGEVGMGRGFRIQRWMVILGFLTCFLSMAGMFVLFQIFGTRA